MTAPTAFFDFDGTLTRGDTLLPFLRFAVGSRRYCRLIAGASPVLAGYSLGLVANDVAKMAVLRRFLAGRPLAELRGIGERFAATVLPGMLREVGMERFEFHRARGHRCVLVSASLDLYLEPWARQQGFSGWLTSSLAQDADGLASGKLHGANCFGQEKVRRIREWLQQEPCSVSYAYGDSAGDLPMLRWANEGWMLRRKAFVAVA